MALGTELFSGKASSRQGSDKSITNSPEHNNAEEEITHYAIIVPGTGPHREDEEHKGVFMKNAQKFQSMLKDTCKREFASANACVEMEPIEFHADMHALASTNPRMDTVTLPSIPWIRTQGRESLGDILYYFTSFHGHRMLDIVICKLNDAYRGFMERHPRFTGQINLIAYSLGGLICYEIMYLMDQRKKHETDSGIGGVWDASRYKDLPDLAFSPNMLFTLGSPLGGAMVFRNLSFDEYLMGSVRYHNIFHPYDPFGYRTEPLVDGSYADTSAMPITSGPDMHGPKSLPEGKDESSVAEVGGGSYHYRHAPRRQSTSLGSYVTDIGRTVVDSMVIAPIRISSSMLWAIKSTTSALVNAMARRASAEKESGIGGQNAAKDDKQKQLPYPERMDYIIPFKKRHWQNGYWVGVRSHLNYWTNKEVVYHILYHMRIDIGIAVGNSALCIRSKPYKYDLYTGPHATKPNPNGVEFDNFYLDMNGIVHPCCHPQFKEAPKTEEAMLLEVFKCLDRVFNLIRPRKVVYMALDGVAPRAKMNQQRSRRFRAAQEAEEKEHEMEKLAEEIFQATGEKQPTPEKPWDSNCITPGTPFMEMLARALRYYVVAKLNTDPAWANVKVILSDSNVPGEGEHKIMDFIRRQRMMPGYDPNTSHVIYGLDADLIMLSLATHEPNFKILREDVEWAQRLSKPCRRCGGKGHFERDCGGRDKPAAEVDPDAQPFVFANIDILREYLEFTLKPEKALSFPFDLERAIDDWVFLCFFVGNDFLPHLPSLEIREGAIEKLVEFWKAELHDSGGYITQCGEVDLFRVQPIIDKIAALEENTFKERKHEEEKRERREAKNNARNGNDYSMEEAANQMAAVAAANARKIRELAEVAQKKKEADAKNFAAASELKARLAARMQKVRTPSPVPFTDEEVDEVVAFGSTGVSTTGTKRPHGGSDDDDNNKDDGDSDAANENGAIDVDNKSQGSVEATVTANDADNDKAEQPPAKRAKTEDRDGSSEAQDDSRTEDDDEQSTATPDENKSEASDAIDTASDPVKFHEDGYKQRYYNLKFHISADHTEELHNIVEHYVRGLCWVLKYYYQGCASWDWYYPYHYAPLASDFVDLDVMVVDFEASEPLLPFEQLMSVLPARSKHNLPEPFGPLMTEDTSPIIDFYPTDFPLDLNGKKFLWQAIILLPFIDKERLLSSVTKVYPKLLPEECSRNERGNEALFVGKHNSLYDSLFDMHATGDPEKKAPLNPKKSGRLSGHISSDPTYVPRTQYESPLKAVGQPDMEDVHFVSALFHNPQPDTNHMCMLLPGFQRRRPALNAGDREFVRSGGDSGFRGPPRTMRHENNHDYSHFYGRQGNDVSRDRGYGPRRYDERGNVNPEYHSYHSSGRGGGHRNRPPPPRPPPGAVPYGGGGHWNAANQYGSGNPVPPRPVGYRPFVGRPATPIAMPTVNGSNDRHRDSYHPPPHGRRGGGNRNGGGHRGGYRGGHRGNYH
ncbi:5'-3' exoribonuclease 2 [Coemansia sp. IMI 209127]|nr:5'-3' exoribonuclease 2 [Coemansia sp. IMI 209127]